MLAMPVPVRPEMTMSLETMTVPAERPHWLVNVLAAVLLVSLELLVVLLELLLALFELLVLLELLELLVEVEGNQSTPLHPVMTAIESSARTTFFIKSPLAKVVALAIFSLP